MKRFFFVLPLAMLTGAQALELSGQVNREELFSLRTNQQSAQQTSGQLCVSAWLVSPSSARISELAHTTTQNLQFKLQIPEELPRNAYLLQADTIFWPNIIDPRPSKIV